MVMTMVKRPRSIHHRETLNEPSLYLKASSMAKLPRVLFVNHTSKIAGAEFVLLDIKTCGLGAVLRRFSSRMVR